MRRVQHLSQPASAKQFQIATSLMHTPVPNYPPKSQHLPIIHFPLLTETLGGGGKYIPADPAAAAAFPPLTLPLDSALVLSLPISSSTFLSAWPKPGLSGLPGKVGLRNPKRDEKVGLFGPDPEPPFSFPFEPKLK